MNETLNLTLSTNPLALLAVGGLIWTVLLGMIVYRIRSSSILIGQCLHAFSKDIERKDFSFKPKYDERTGELKTSDRPMFNPFFM